MKNILEKIQKDNIASDIDLNICINNDHYVKIASWEEYGEKFLLLKLNNSTKCDADSGKII